jgi:hypothetical protein
VGSPWFASVLSGVAAGLLFAVPIAAHAVETPRRTAAERDPFLWVLHGGKVLKLPQMRPGLYSCRDRERTRFTILDGSRYRDTAETSGTYFLDRVFGTILFHGAGLDGRQLSSDACALQR